MRGLVRSTQQILKFTNESIYKISSNITIYKQFFLVDRHHVLQWLDPPFTTTLCDTHPAACVCSQRGRCRRREGRKRRCGWKGLSCRETSLSCGTCRRSSSGNLLSHFFFFVVISRQARKHVAKRRWESYLVGGARGFRGGRHRNFFLFFVSRMFRCIKEGKIFVLLNSQSTTALTGNGL